MLFFRTAERSGLLASLANLLQRLPCTVEILCHARVRFTPLESDEQRDANLILQIARTLRLMEDSLT